MYSRILKVPCGNTAAEKPSCEACRLTQVFGSDSLTQWFAAISRQPINEQLFNSILFLQVELTECTFKTQDCSSISVANAIWSTGAFYDAAARQNQFTPLLDTYLHLVTTAVDSSHVCLDLQRFELPAQPTSLLLSPTIEAPQGLGFDVLANGIQLNVRYFVTLQTSIGTEFLYRVTFPTAFTIIFIGPYPNAFPITVNFLQASKVLRCIPCQPTSAEPDEPCCPCPQSHAENVYSGVYDAVGRSPHLASDIEALIDVMRSYIKCFFPNGVDRLKGCELALYNAIQQVGGPCTIVSRIQDIGLATRSYTLLVNTLAKLLIGKTLDDCTFTNNSLQSVFSNFYK